MRLSLGAGPLPRLCAPGRPDWIGADGETIGWIVRDRLFLLRDGAVDMVDLPEEAEDACASPPSPGETGGRWTVAFGNGFVHVDIAAADVVAAIVDDERDPVSARPGRDVGLFVEVPEHRLLRLSDGLALPLPDAAVRARWIRPWETGIGACWIDFDTLYRLGGRISALGRAPGAEGIRCGPEGAVLVTLTDDTVVAAPRGLAVRVGQRLDADSARFSPDGNEVLAASEDGVVHVDLRDGTVIASWEGNFGPVGFAGGPVLWDLDRGTLVRGDVDVLGGVTGATPSCVGARLAGPGGAAWDLATGERVADGLVGGACATDGACVVHVDDTTVRVVGGPSFEHHLLSGEDDAVERARIDGDTLVIETLDGEVGLYALSDGTPRGRRRASRREEAPRPELSVPADGTTVAPGGETWAWTDEGMLVILA